MDLCDCDWPQFWVKIHEIPETTLNPLFPQSRMWIELNSTNMLLFPCHFLEVAVWHRHRIMCALIVRCVWLWDTVLVTALICVYSSLTVAFEAAHVNDDFEHFFVSVAGGNCVFVRPCVRPKNLDNLAKKVLQIVPTLTAMMLYSKWSMRDFGVRRWKAKVREK